ncbi:MAG: isoprenylcysteine carboxylmethyltransferase family protein, partial [Ignavibacteria bacterium]|nr:isoprenylcysteine carboxylmethyltransferase family protein [Ignavibacteria bacterium]
GTPVPINPPEQLIISGPYSISRNPMVTGLLLQFFGFGLIMDSVTLSFITSPLLTILMTAELKFIEEPELIKRFGNSYLEYMKEVPMFLPGFRRKKKSG